MKSIFEKSEKKIFNASNTSFVSMERKIYPHSSLKSKLALKQTSIASPNALREIENQDSLIKNIQEILESKPSWS